MKEDDDEKALERDHIRKLNICLHHTLVNIDEKVFKKYKTPENKFIAIIVIILLLKVEFWNLE